MWNISTNYRCSSEGVVIVSLGVVYQSGLFTVNFKSGFTKGQYRLTDKSNGGKKTTKTATRVLRMGNYIFETYGRAYFEEFMGAWREWALQEGIIKPLLMTKEAIKMREHNKKRL